jgi:hypothetical protein
MTTRTAKTEPTIATVELKWDLLAIGAEVGAGRKVDDAECCSDGIACFAELVEV